MFGQVDMNNQSEVLLNNNLRPVLRNIINQYGLMTTFAQEHGSL